MDIMRLVDVKVKPPAYGVGSLEASRDSEGGPPPRGITRELQKIKSRNFSRDRGGEHVEAWLEGMT